MSHDFTIEGDRVRFADGASRPATEVEQELWASSQQKPFITYTFAELSEMALMMIVTEDIEFEAFDRAGKMLKDLGFRGTMLMVPPGVQIGTFSRDALKQLVKECVVEDGESSETGFLAIGTIPHDVMRQLLDKNMADDKV